MALIEVSHCKIEKLNTNGLGISSTEKGKVELPFTLVGEEAEFERHSYRGNQNFILKNINTYSPERVAAPCKFFTRCGGCLLQHLSENSYKNFKTSLIQNELNLIDEIEIITPQNPKRRKLNLVFKKNENQLNLGFYRFRTEQIINIDSCIVAEENLSNLIMPLRELLDNILQASDHGEVYILAAGNGIALKIIVESKENFAEKQRRKLKALIGKYNIIKISYLHNKQLVFIQNIEEPYVKFDDTKVFVEADSFLQATKDSDQIIANYVLKHLKEDKNKKIAELFCGRGTITIPLINQGFDVSGFENDKNALMALAQVKKELVKKLYLRDLFFNPLLSELQNYDIIILNPPRTGAEQQVKKILEFNNIKKVIYISCNPQTLARDAAILNKKFNLSNIVALDQFLWSPHVEVIAVFKRL